MSQEPEYIELQLESQKVETETQTEAPMLTESGTQATTATTTTSSGPSELQQRDTETQAAPIMIDAASGSPKRPADALPQVSCAKPLVPRKVGTKRNRAETEEQQTEINELLQVGDCKTLSVRARADMSTHTHVYVCCEALSLSKP